MSDKIDMNVSQIAGTGWRLMDADQNREAISFLEHILIDYPDQHRHTNMLGELHQKMDMPDKAVLYFEKTLKLKPDNEYAKEMLAKITTKGNSDK